MMLAIALFFVAAGLLGPCEADDQFLVCYNDLGDSYNFTKNAYNLTKLEWNDQISNCCFNGIWLLYEDTYFNRDSPDSVTYQYALLVCEL